MLTDVMYFMISVLVLFPYPLQLGIMGYHFQPAFLLIFLALVCSPIIFFKRSYWHPWFTKLLWLMRVTYIAIFLTASFKFGLDLGRIVSFCGYLAISFSYEIPFAFSHMNAKRFYKVFNLVFLLVLFYATFIIGYYAISRGSLMAATVDIRGVLFLYPNHFGILLVLVFWIRQYYLDKRSRIVDLWIVMLIVVSLSRTCMAVFLITCIANIMMNSSLRRWNKLLMLGLILFLCMPIMLSAMSHKAESPGSTLERTLYGRIDRWVAAADIIRQNVIIGTGFDRTTTVVPVFQSSSSDGLYLLGSMHNDYLDLLLKGGIVGLIAQLLVFVGIFVLGRRYDRSLIVILMTIALTGLLQNPFKNLNLMFFLYFTTGVMLVDRRKYY